MPDPLKKAVQYIKNAGGGLPLQTKYFDDDWEPIGSQFRKELKEAGLILETQGHMILTRV